MNALVEHPLVIQLGWTLLHFLWQGAAVAVLLALVLWLARSSSPATRYGFACAALLAMVVAPIATFALIKPAQPASAPAAAMPISAIPPEAPFMADAKARLAEDSRTEGPPNYSAAALPLPSQAASETPRVSTAWQAFSVGAWLAGVVVLSIRHALGLLRLRELRKSAEPIRSAELQAVLARLRERLGITRAVQLLSSARVHAPAVIGFFKPAILFPVSALTGLSQAQLTAVLAHELAHVRRCDFAVNLLQCLIETILFYHPGVWWVSRVARREREFCADDIAIEAGNDRISYAKALTRLAELDASKLAVAATGGSLLTRIKRIVGRPEPRRGGALTVIFGMVTAAVLTATLLVSQTNAQDNSLIEVKEGESIQGAVDRASEGGTVRVGAGEFRERVRIAKRITLEGAGWDKTRIVLPPDDPKKRKEFEERIQAAKTTEQRNKLIEDSRASLDGPTLSIHDAKGVSVRAIRVMGMTKGDTGGQLPPTTVIREADVRIADTALTGPGDEGIHVLDGSNVEIANCLIAGFGREGLTIRGAAGADPKVVFRDSELRNVYHYGMSIGRGCDRVTVQRCRISGTMWHGIRYDDASPLIEGNLIYGHARSGVYASGRTRATIRGNVFFRNEMSGVSCWFNNEDLIEQNTFAANQREGLAVLGASKPKVRGNIFYSNPEGITQGSIGDDPTNSTGAAILENNFFWKNGKNVAVKEKEALTDETKSILQDPKFSDAEKGDFKLAADSPAAKAGAGAREPLALASPWPIQAEEKKFLPEASKRAGNVAQSGAASNPAVNVHQKRAQLYSSVESIVKDALQIDDAEKREAAVEKIRGMIGSKDETEVARGLVAYASIGPVSFDKTSFRDALLAKLASEDPFIRSQAITALSGGAGTREDLARITELSKDDDPTVRGAVAWAIIWLTKKDLTGPEGAKWMEMFEAANSEAQRDMIRGLWGVKTTTAMQDRLVAISRADRGLGYDTLYYALSTSPNKQAATVTRLIEYLAAADTTNVAGRAAWGLGYGVEPSEKARVAEAMIKVYNAREDGYMRRQALDALPNYARAEHVAELEKIIAKPGIAAEDKKQLEGIIAVARQRK